MKKKKRLDVCLSLSLQRLLIVPPKLAYGSKGVQEIPPNATIEVIIAPQINYRSCQLLKLHCSSPWN